MAALHRSLARYDSNRGECEVAFDGNKKIYYDYYPASSTPASDRLVVLSPGWIGSLTFNRVAKVLSEYGHDVALVNHLYGSKSDVFTPNAARSRRVHAVTKAAAERTNKTQVHFMSHSNGTQDVVGAVKHQFNRSEGDLSYVIDKITSNSGAGTNGKRINPMTLIREIENLESYTGSERNRVAMARVLGYSALNFTLQPIKSVVEGIGAVTYDATKDMELFEKLGVSTSRSFHYDDWVVRPPDDLDGVLMYPGGHFTAATDPDVFIELAAA